MTVFSNLCFASSLDLISFIMFLMFMGMAAFPYIIIGSLFIFGFRIAFDTVQQASLDAKKENQNNRLLEQRNKKYVTVGENIRKNLKALVISSFKFTPTPRLIMLCLATLLLSSRIRKAAARCQVHQSKIGKVLSFLSHLLLPIGEHKDFSALIDDIDEDSL